MYNLNIKSQEVVSDFKDLMIALWTRLSYHLVIIDV